MPGNTLQFDDYEADDIFQGMSDEDLNNFTDDRKATAKPKYMRHFRSEEDRRNAIRSYAEELQNEDRVVKEEALSKDKTWIEASRALHKYVNGFDIDGDDETIAKYGLDEMGKFNYNLGLGTIPMAMNIDDADDEQKMALFYMMETYDEKDTTLAGIGRFFEGIASDPTSYMFGAGLMGRASAGAIGKEGFKAALKAKVAQIASSKTAQGATAGAAYTGLDDALRQEITMGAGYLEEYDPFRGAMAMALGATAGAALINAVPIVKELGRGAKRMVQEKIDTPMGDMLTGTMRMQESGKVPTKGLLERQAEAKAKSVKPKGKEIFNPETERTYIIGDDGDVYFDSNRGWRKTEQFGIKQRLEKIDEIGYDEFKAREDKAQAEMKRMEQEEWDKAQKTKESGDYKMEHTAPTSDVSNASGYDPTEVFGEDIYSSQAVRYFGHGDKNMDEASVRTIKSMKGNPDKEVTIYRAVPKGVKDINKGDWITINKKYAKGHGESALDGKYDIIEMKVKAKDIFTDGNSIHEWGYDPQGSK